MFGLATAFGIRRLASAAVRVVPVPNSVQKHVPKSQRVRVEHKRRVERARRRFRAELLRVVRAGFEVDGGGVRFERRVDSKRAEFGNVESRRYRSIGLVRGESVL